MWLTQARPLKCELIVCLLMRQSCSQVSHGSLAEQWFSPLFADSWLSWKVGTGYSRLLRDPEQGPSDKSWVFCWRALGASAGHGHVVGSEYPGPPNRGFQTSPLPGLPRCFWCADLQLYKCEPSSLITLFLLLLLLPQKIIPGSWEGNRQEGQGSPNGGKRLQVPDIFISLKRQEEKTSDMSFLLYTNLKGGFSQQAVWPWHLVSPEANYSQTLI